MKLSGVAIAVAVLLVGACTPRPKKIKYAAVLTGTPFLKEAKLGTAYPETIPFGTKLESLGLQHGVEYKNGGFAMYYKVRLGDRAGWVRHDHVDEKPPRHYYRIIARNGLRLRSHPSLQAKVVAVLPYSQIGEILEPTRRVEKIDDRSGYWFRTSFNGRQGWIFSGYTLNSPSKDLLEREKRAAIRVVSSELKPYGGKEEDLVRNGMKEVVLDSPRYMGFFVKYKVANDDCTGPASRIYFKEKKSGAIVTNDSYYAETPLKTALPFPHAFLSSIQYCNCCCPQHGAHLYVETAQGIRMVEFELSGKAQCFDGAPFSYESINKSVPDQRRLLLFWRRPECLVPVGEKQPNSGTPIKLFSRDVFASIQLLEDGTLVIEQVQDGANIPEKFREIWEKAAPL